MSAVALEKRKHARVPLGLTFDVNLKGQGAAKCRASISDLSQGGMTFKTNAELENGMCLQLVLGNKLHIRGEVRHIKGADRAGLRSYGVRFHKIFESQSIIQEN